MKLQLLFDTNKQVTTDIVVLIDFYQKDRMVFFGISLAILILAQCAYSIAFTLRFETLDRWDWLYAAVAFCCLLPCGSFLAFFIYLASGEDSRDAADRTCMKKLLRKLNLSGDKPSLFRIDKADGELIKWIKIKMDKHLGSDSFHIVNMIIVCLNIHRICD